MEKVTLILRKMAFDFKKEYKEFYLPPEKPVIVTVPKANFIAVRGKGDCLVKSVFRNIWLQKCDQM